MNLATLDEPKAPATVANLATELLMWVGEGHPGGLTRCCQCQADFLFYQNALTLPPRAMFSANVGRSGFRPLR